MGVLSWVVKTTTHSKGVIRMNEQELFEIVRNCYAEANKEYLLQQREKASIYLTDEQREQLGLKQPHTKG